MATVACRPPALSTQRGKGQSPGASAAGRVQSCGYGWDKASLNCSELPLNGCLCSGDGGGVAPHLSPARSPLHPCLHLRPGRPVPGWMLGAHDGPPRGRSGHAHPGLAPVSGIWDVVPWAGLSGTPDPNWLAGRGGGGLRPEPGGPPNPVPRLPAVGPRVGRGAAWESRVGGPWAGRGA